jgi:hypothetical protein
MTKSFTFLIPSLYHLPKGRGKVPKGYHPSFPDIKSEKAESLPFAYFLKRLRETFCLLLKLKISRSDGLNELNTKIKIV